MQYSIKEIMTHNCFFLWGAKPLASPLGTPLYEPKVNHECPK